MSERGDLAKNGEKGRMSRKRFLAMATALGMAPAAAGAMLEGAVDVAAAPADATNRYYAIAHSGPSDPFWAIESRGVAAAGRDLHVNAVFEGPPTFSISGEVDLFNAAVASRPLGIAVTLADPHALSAPINRALSQGVEVILFNAQDFAHNTRTVGYVGQDETTSGERLAQHMLPHLRSGDRVVVAIHQPGLSVLELRYRGVKRVLGAHHMIVDKLNTGVDITAAIGIIQSYFSRHPDTKAIATLGPLGTAPAGKFVTERGLAHKVVIGAFDLDTVTLHYIQNGVVLGTVDQQPFLQGYMAIVQLVVHHRYGMTPALINTGTLWIDRSNVKQLANLVKKGIGG
jgi:simple sugar transport system substrate-binding protein